MMRVLLMMMLRSGSGDGSGFGGLSRVWRITVGGGGRQWAGGC